MAVYELAVNGRKTGVKVNKADSFAARSLGLMGKPSADPGLLITRCGSIHTFFMKTSIDAVFIDEDGCAVRLMPLLKPWRVVMPVLATLSVLELAPGAISKLGLRENDVLTLIPPSQ